MRQPGHMFETGFRQFQDRQLQQDQDWRGRRNAADRAFETSRGTAQSKGTGWDKFFQMANDQGVVFGGGGALETVQPDAAAQARMDEAAFATNPAIQQLMALQNAKPEVQQPSFEDMQKQRLAGMQERAAGYEAERNQEAASRQRQEAVGRMNARGPKAEPEKVVTNYGKAAQNRMQQAPAQRAAMQNATQMPGFMGRW